MGLAAHNRRRTSSSSLTPASIRWAWSSRRNRLSALLRPMTTKCCSCAPRGKVQRPLLLDVSFALRTSWSTCPRGQGDRKWVGYSPLLVPYAHKDGCVVHGDWLQTSWSTCSRGQGGVRSGGSSGSRALGAAGSLAGDRRQRHALIVLAGSLPAMGTSCLQGQAGTTSSMSADHASVAPSAQSCSSGRSSVCLAPSGCW